MPFKFTRLSISSVVLVEPLVFRDERGFFMEAFKLSEFKGFGIDFEPVQENHSMSKRGVVRGLHYQLDPYAQAKLVRVVSGSIFDVAVDIRRSSPTFGKWVGVELSAENKQLLFVPRGFAHGFAALEDDTEVVYLVDNEYSREHERGIIWNDPDIGIEWPFSEPILSDKDRKWPLLSEAEVFP